METYEKMTDEQLIAALRKGESEIMDFIMEKYKYLVRKKAKAMFLLGGENDDLIQEGMIGLFKAVRDYDLALETSFASFAELCISRQMYSAIEASKRKKDIHLKSDVSLYEEGDASEENKRPPLIDTIQPDRENNPEELFLNKEYFRQAESMLKEQLSDLENRVLYLHLLGTEYQTIAKLIGKSPKAVDNALQRIKSKAQGILNHKKE